MSFNNSHIRKEWQIDRQGRTSSTSVQIKNQTTKKHFQHLSRHTHRIYLPDRTDSLQQKHTTRRQFGGSVATRKFDLAEILTARDHTPLLSPFSGQSKYSALQSKYSAIQAESQTQIPPHFPSLTPGPRVIKTKMNSKDLDFTISNQLLTFQHISYLFSLGKVLISFLAELND